MRRIFEDERGNKLEQLDLWDYGYDARERSWYRDTVQAKRPVVSPPYLSFSIAAPIGSRRLSGMMLPGNCVRKTRPLLCVTPVSGS